jgi:hypothetical protein
LNLYLLLVPGREQAAIVADEAPELAGLQSWFVPEEVLALGTAREGVPAGRVGYLDRYPTELARVLRGAQAGQGPGGVG